MPSNGEAVWPSKPALGVDLTINQAYYDHMSIAVMNVKIFSCVGAPWPHLPSCQIPKFFGGWPGPPDGDDIVAARRNIASMAPYIVAAAPIISSAKIGASHADAPVNAISSSAPGNEMAIEKLNVIGKEATNK